MFRKLLCLSACWVVAAAAAGPTDEARQLVRRAGANYLANMAELDLYGFERRVERIEYDGDDRVKKREVVTHLTALVDGVRTGWVTARDDKPLDAADQAITMEHVRNDVAEWKAKSEAERARILAERRKSNRFTDEFIKEFPDALDFTPTGVRTLDGRETLAFTFVPRPGYRPKKMEARVFSKVRGTLFIDKADGQLVLMEVEVFENTTMGLILARLEKGTRFEFRQQRLDSGRWVLASTVVRYDMRVLLVKAVNRLVDTRYRKFRRLELLQPVAGNSSGSR